MPPVLCVPWYCWVLQPVRGLDVCAHIFFWLHSAVARHLRGVELSCQQHDLRCLGRDWLRNEDMTRGVTAEAARCLSGLSEAGPDNASSALCPMVMLGVATRMGPRRMYAHFFGCLHLLSAAQCRGCGAPLQVIACSHADTATIPLWLCIVHCALSPTLMYSRCHSELALACTQTLVRQAGILGMPCADRRTLLMYSSGGLQS